MEITAELDRDKRTLHFFRNGILIPIVIKGRTNFERTLLLGVCFLTLCFPFFLLSLAFSLYLSFL
jgi:hypothetical protein